MAESIAQKAVRRLASTSKRDNSSVAKLVKKINAPPNRRQRRAAAAAARASKEVSRG